MLLLLLLQPIAFAVVSIDAANNDDYADITTANGGCWSFLGDGYGQATTAAGHNNANITCTHNHNNIQLGGWVQMPCMRQKTKNFAAANNNNDDYFIVSW